MVKGPVSNRKISRRKMREAMIIGGAIVALVVVLGGAWFGFNKLSQSREASKLQDMEGVVQGLADSGSEMVAVYVDNLRKLADSEKVREALTADDASVMQTRADELIAEFDAGLKLRILKPGNFERDSTSTPPLGFRSIGLLEQAVQSEQPVKVEVHFNDSPQEHIVMIERVKGADDQLIGLLHLSLDASLLESLLKDKAIEGYVELQQTGVGKKLTLNRVGPKSIKAGKGISKPIKSTRWQVVYWSGSAPAESGSGGGMFMIIIAVVVILLLGAGAFLFMRNNRPAVSTGSIADEQVVYAGAVEAIMHGAHPGMEKLVPNLPNMGTQKSITPVSQGMVGEDVTMIMKAPDLEQAAAEAQDNTPINPATPKAEATPAPASNDDTPAPASDQPAEKQADSSDSDIDAGIFRAYDIRGVVNKNFTVDVVNKIAQAIGSEAVSRGEQGIIVGRDGRTSSPELAESLIKGLRASGRDVIDIGMVPTPLLYFATHFLEANSGVMLTGSHNGPEYNGLKIVLAGETLAEGAIKELYKRTVAGEFETGQGNLQTADITADYVRRISEDIPVALGGALKIVIDAGNGIAGAVAPQLFRALGHDVIELYCDVDGNFPNHHPDPTQPKNLQELIEKVKGEQADIGFAFDGDGDRLGVVDNTGNIIWPDRQLMLFAKDVLKRNEGAAIIYDVKCSRYLKAIIEASGGKAQMWRTGHSLIKAKMKQEDAPLAGEMSGHIFFKERWYGFDDAMYAAARMVEIIVNAKTSAAELFAEMPEGVSTPELKVKVAEKHHQAVMDKLKEKMNFPGAEIIDLDGIRVEFDDGWGLIRPSNTTPCLVLRFEAESDAALERIQTEFRSLLESVNPKLTF